MAQDLQTIEPPEAPAVTGITSDAPAPPGTAAVSVLNRPMITLSIMLATLMQSLDSTIANVALPHMQGALSASQDEITWVLTSYIVAAAIAMPLTGWLAARLGVKHLLAASIIGFTIASGLCGIAQSLPQIVIARLLQGMFGASLVPLSQSILLDINPRERQGRAMAVWGMGVMVGPILGPTLGGWLTESLNWRWVFFINLPVGAVALFGACTYLPKNTRKPGQSLDFFGFATLSLAVGALQALLDRGEQLDWFNSIEIRIEALIAVIAMAFFVVHTKAASNSSFFRRELLRDRNFVTGIFFAFVVGAVLYATRSAAAADAAIADELRRVELGPRQRAQRYRHADRDAACEPSDWPRRCTPAASDRFHDLSASAVADDALHARALRIEHRLARRDSGFRTWSGIRAAQHCVVLHAAWRTATRRHRDL